MLQLEEKCKVSVADYDERNKIRSEELKALNEVIQILSDEDSRALVGRTLSFVQTRAVSLHTQMRGKQEAAVQMALRRASSVISVAARKSKDWVLASLAMRVHLDSFTK